jgi:hypothetical protein
MAEVMVHIWATQAEQGRPLDTAPKPCIADRSIVLHAEVKHSVSEAESAVLFRCGALLS